jgi:Nuclear protein Es2
MACLDCIIKRKCYPSLKEYEDFRRTEDPQGFLPQRSLHDPETQYLLEQNPRLKKIIEDEKITIGSFLTKYTSEDNKSLEQLIEAQEEKWKQKFWWVFQAEKQYKERQGELEEESQKKMNNMLMGLGNKNLRFANYETKSNFIFPAVMQMAVKQVKEAVPQEIAQLETIDYSNTRFSEIPNKKKNKEVDMNALRSIVGEETASRLASHRRMATSGKATPLLGFRKASQLPSERSEGGSKLLHIETPVPCTFLFLFLTFKSLSFDDMGTNRGHTTCTGI